MIKVGSDQFGRLGENHLILLLPKRRKRYLGSGNFALIVSELILADQPVALYQLPDNLLSTTRQQALPLPLVYFLQANSATPLNP
jgi:hypothetical protein